MLAALSLLSLWSWRSLIARGIVGTAPPYFRQGDVGQGILFLRWLPFALSHGLNPFFSRMMFAPQGINLLSNTSFFLTGFILAPVTIWLGPVASFDIAVIAAPVISGYALYWVLRRYGFGVPPALIASLFYCYCPYMTHESALGHFNLTWMFFPPLLVFLLDEIFVRHELRWWVSGLLLAALAVVQFFNSPEIMLDGALLASVLLVAAAATHPRAVASHLRKAAAPCGLAVATAGAVLAYPLWYMTSGPQHVTTFNSTVSTIDNAVTSALWPSALSIFGSRPPFLGRIDSGFIGPAACLAVVLACLLWRRYRLAPYAAFGAAVSYVLTWGPYLRISSSGFTHVKGPDFWLLGIPFLRNLQEYRFAAFTDLFVAICIAACLDRASSAFGWAGSANRAGSVITGLVAAAVVLAFPLLGGDWHEPVAAVTVPTVFTQGPLTRVPIGTLAVVSPPDFINSGGPLVWQAEAGIRYDETDGYAWRQVDKQGLGSTVEPRSPLDTLIGPDLWDQFAIGSIPSPPLRESSLAMQHLRATLIAWDVSEIVFVRGYPDQQGLDARIVTALLGHLPARVGGSLIWTRVTERLEARRSPYAGLVLRR